MTVQLPLPASWARNFVGMPDPRDRLDALLRDRDDTKAEMRLALDRLADKHGVPSRDVDLAMLSVEDSIGDLVYDIEHCITRSKARSRTSHAGASSIEVVASRLIRTVVEMTRPGHFPSASDVADGQQPDFAAEVYIVSFRPMNLRSWRRTRKHP